MNVLFVAHNSINNNSGYHIHNYANRLVKLGLNCAVAVTGYKEVATELGQTHYQLYEYAEALSSSQLFSNGEGPDIVHAWTPREGVRLFCQQLQKRYSFRLIIHLEDNEEYLTETFLRRNINTLRHLPLSQLDSLIGPTLFHPLRGQEFLQTASGVTVIIDQLAEFVPEYIPTITLWASADETLFFEKPLNTQLRCQLEIPENHTVLVYAGNVHAANAQEVRSLYLAVALLNRQGRPTTLIRAGLDYLDFLGDNGRWCEPFVKNLGAIPHKAIPDVMAAANIFVQPGLVDNFNKYRLPSKLPEFFAIGRPVILPATNLGLHLRHLSEAYVLPQADAVHITEAIKLIGQDLSLYQRLQQGALEFAATHFSGRLLGQKLAEFYQKLMQQN